MSSIVGIFMLLNFYFGPVWQDEALPCTAADLHSRVGDSCALQRRKMRGARCIAIQKTIAVIVQYSNLAARGKKCQSLIAILFLAFVFGCLPPVSRRSCSELEADPSVSLGEFYSHCRAHSNVN